MIKTGCYEYELPSDDAGYVYVFKENGRKLFAEQHKHELEQEDYDFLLTEISSGRAFRFQIYGGKYSLRTASIDFYIEKGYKIIEFDNYEKLKEKQRTE